VETSIESDERSSSEHVNEFVKDLIHGLEARLRRAGVEPGLVSEVISLALFRLAPRVNTTLERYLSGDVYAQAIWKSVLIDTLRTEGAQRGSGLLRLSEIGSHDAVSSESVELEAQLLLREALEQLSSKERTDLCRFFIGGFNMCEISKMNGESHTTVGRRVRRATARARRTLESL